MIKEFLENFNDVRFENNLYLNWGDLNELKDFVAIGSHTHTHPMLGKILNENEIYDQMVVSKNHIKKNLNIDCEIISYPNGSYNNLVKNCAQKAGYKYGLAVNNTTYKEVKFDDFELPRIELYEENKFKAFLRRNQIIESIKKLK